MKKTERERFADCTLDKLQYLLGCLRRSRPALRTFADCTLDKLQYLLGCLRRSRPALRICGLHLREAAVPWVALGEADQLVDICGPSLQISDGAL